MQLYFIRHGQSANNLLWEQTGSDDGRSDDPELTDIGRQQTESLTRFLCQSGIFSPSDNRDPQNIAGFGLTHLYTSLMVRAVSTAAIVAEALGLPLIAGVDLHEGGGIYLDDENGYPVGRPGKSRSYFMTRFPTLVLPDSLDDEGWWNRPYELHIQRNARAQRVWQDILTRHGNTNDRVAIFSHGGFYNHLLAALLNIPYRTPNGSHWFHINNVGITRFDFSTGRVDIIYQNRVDFLPRELIT
jgi:2,3-bisphosphoglycerate-dependent phosphoglycerate mutase